MEYRIVEEKEIGRDLFCDFVRHQVVDKCLRRKNGEWVVCSDPFVDDWSEEDYEQLIYRLRSIAHCGGFVYGAFCSVKLKGFVSVEKGLFGGENRYCDLSFLHVSEDFRRHGIGRTLFIAAANWALGQGARKLYISAHSAAESQAFYRALGCVEATEYNRKHVEEEPLDCQLEFCLPG